MHLDILRVLESAEDFVQYDLGIHRDVHPVGPEAFCVPFYDGAKTGDASLR